MQDFNMRWIGSLVADAWRIFRRGGILYPLIRVLDMKLGVALFMTIIAFLVEAAKDMMEAILFLIFCRQPFLRGCHLFLGLQ